MAVGTDYYESRKHRAHNIVRKAIKSGEILPASNYKCVDCGKIASLYDHRDYSKPLEIDPVCRACNNRRGPAVDAPSDLRKSGEPFKSLMTNARGGGIKVDPRNADYIDTADFPGRLVVCFDESIVECIEENIHWYRDPDVSVAMKTLMDMGPKKYRGVAA